MVGYQYAVTSQPVHTAPGTAEGEADPEADWIEEKSSARKQLRSSGVAAAAAIQSEGAEHSQGKLYASANAEHAPMPSSEDSARSSTPPKATSCAPASTGDQNQPSGSLTNDHNSEPAPSQREDVEEELPYVHVQTPRGSQPSEAASPRTPGMSTPESTGRAGESTEPHTTADGWSRREADVSLPEAAECFGSPCSSVEERVAQSAECSSSGRGTVGFVQLSAGPGLQHMRWAMGSEGGQWPQLEHWDEATAFWGAFSRQLNINPEALTAGERVQLAGVLLQAWTAFQQKGHHEETSQLQAEANMHHAAQATAAQQASAVKQARFEHDLHTRQLAQFRSALGDGLLFGMAVMLASAAACGYVSGVGDLLFGHCRPMSSITAFSIFRPWAALEFGGVLACWAMAVSDVLVAALVMWLVGRHMAATGALVGAHGAPLRKLALGLGAGCGLAGYFVIDRLHGDWQRWLLGWEMWVALHALVAWCMPSLLRALAAQPYASRALGQAALTAGAAKGRVKWVDWLGLPLYHAMMVLIIPALVGFAPFSRRLSVQNLWDALIA
ncbi:g8258 [Coccomyxa elongata]